MASIPALLRTRWAVPGMPTMSLWKVWAWYIFSQLLQAPQNGFQG